MNQTLKVWSYTTESTELITHCSTYKLALPTMCRRPFTRTTPVGRSAQVANQFSHFIFHLNSFRNTKYFRSNLFEWRTKPVISTCSSLAFNISGNTEEKTSCRGMCFKRLTCQRFANSSQLLAKLVRSFQDNNQGNRKCTASHQGAPTKS